MNFPSNDDISIKEYFKGQSIFVTGGQGLVGKVLIEKILRSCPDVSTIYVLIRPKKNLTVEERWSTLTDLPLFDRLKKERPDALSKVVLLPGDLRENDLGLSEDNLQLLKNNVTLVYHVAALVQFRDDIRAALLENVGGTQKVLELAKGLTKLQVFIHVSTAYSNANLPSNDSVEKVIPACQDWRAVMKTLDTYPVQLETLKQKLLCGHPNTYTWSKSLAEQLVNSYREHFPIIIMRPSIVCSTIEADPIEGWIDAANGFSIVAASTGFGILRVLPTSKDGIQDFVQVDFAVKALIIAPWKHHILQKDKQLDEKTPVYNCGMTMTIPVTNLEIELVGMEQMEKCPSEHMVWERSIVYAPNEILFRILFFLKMVLPALLVDIALRIIGKQPIALKMARKAYNGLRLIGNIRNKKMLFPNVKFVQLGLNLKEEDKKDFFYDIASYDKKELISKNIIGFRKYFLKEDLSEEAVIKNGVRFQKIQMIATAVNWVTYLGASSIILYIFKNPIISLLEI